MFVRACVRVESMRVCHFISIDAFHVVSCSFAHATFTTFLHGHAFQHISFHDFSLHGEVQADPKTFSIGLRVKDEYKCSRRIKHRHAFRYAPAPIFGNVKYFGTHLARLLGIRSAPYRFFLPVAFHACWLFTVAFSVAV